MGSFVSKQDDSSRPTVHVPQYLIDNVHRVVKCEQTLPPWSHGYDKFRNHGPVERLYVDYDSRRLQRRDVIRLFAGSDLVLALVAAMIWGGITSQNLERMLETDEPKLRKGLVATKSLVCSGRTRKAFEQLQPGGDNKIEGVGSSYHTKILYFTGQAAQPKPSIPPLILDKWTKNAYFALLNQLNDSRADRFFVRRLAGKNKDGIVTRSNLADCYEAYITDMNGWATELSKRAKAKIESWRLEQFVFGRGRDRSADNPRLEILKMIRASI